MVSQKVVTPVKTGVQGVLNLLKFLDSGFRRNDIFEVLATFCETSHFFLDKKGLFDLNIYTQKNI